MTIADELMMIGRTQLLRLEGLAFLAATNPAEDHEMLFDPVTEYLLQSILKISFQRTSNTLILYRENTLKRKSTPSTNH